MRKFITAIMCVFLFALIVIPLSDLNAQVNVNSRWIRGNLVYHDATNYRVLLDAVGPEVIKWQEEFINQVWVDTLSLQSTFNGSIGGIVDTAFTLAGWKTVAVSAGTGNSTVQKVDSLSGVIKLNSAANDNDGIQMQMLSEMFSADSANDGYLYAGFEVALKDSLVGTTAKGITQSDILIGLCAKEDSLIIKPRQGAGLFFHKIDGNTYWRATANNGTSADTTVSTTAVSANTWTKLHIFYDGVNNKAYFYVNNTLIKTASSFNPVKASQYLTPSIAYLNGAATMADFGLYVRNIKVIQIDPNR